MCAHSRAHVATMPRRPVTWWPVSDFIGMDVPNCYPPLGAILARNPGARSSLRRLVCRYDGAPLRLTPDGWATGGRSLARQAAEARLGRELLRTECVEFVDGNRLNASPGNVRVVERQSKRGRRGSP